MSKKRELWRTHHHKNMGLVEQPKIQARVSDEHNLADVSGSAKILREFEARARARRDASLKEFFSSPSLRKGAEDNSRNSPAFKPLDNLPPGWSTLESKVHHQMWTHVSGAKVWKHYAHENYKLYHYCKPGKDTADGYRDTRDEAMSCVVSLGEQESRNPTLATLDRKLWRAGDLVRVIRQRRSDCQKIPDKHKLDINSLYTILEMVSVVTNGAAVYKDRLYVWDNPLMWDSDQFELVTQKFNSLDYLYCTKDAEGLTCGKAYGPVRYYKKDSFLSVKDNNDRTLTVQRDDQHSLWTHPHFVRCGPPTAERRFNNFIRFIANTSRFTAHKVYGPVIPTPEGQPAVIDDRGDLTLIALLQPTSLYFVGSDPVSITSST